MKEARAIGRPTVSFKQSTEIAKHVRGKKVEDAKKILEQVIAMKKPIKYTRYNKGVGHKPGIGPGRYPIKASKAILALVNSATSNAEDKGLTDLVVSHITTSKLDGIRQSRHRSDGKRTFIEVRVKQV